MNFIIIGCGRVGAQLEAIRGPGEVAFGDRFRPAPAGHGTPGGSNGLTGRDDKELKGLIPVVQAREKVPWPSVAIGEALPRALMPVVHIPDPQARHGGGICACPP